MEYKEQTEIGYIENKAVAENSRKEYDRADILALLVK